MRRLRWGLVAGAISALATGIGVASDLGLPLRILDWSDASDPTLRPMGGTYNIAVSDFAATGQDSAEIAGEGRSLAGGISAELAQTLCATRSAGYDVECRGPGDVPLVEGDGAAERAERAAAIAEDLRADVLVYGTVSEQRGQVSAQPAIYISARRLPQLEELAGAHQLVTGGGYIGTGQERRNAIDALRQRIANLIGVMFTLDKYNLGEADEARALLDELTEDDEWQFDRYILELVTGNVLAKLRDWPAAVEHYDESLRLYREAIGATYSRATVGKAEAIYHQLRELGGGPQDCTPEPSAQSSALIDGLEATLDQFAAGRRAAEEEHAGVIVRKADYGTGRVQTCLAQAGEADYWPQAEATFADLVRTLDDLGERPIGLTSIEDEILAESHAFLGFIDWRRTDGPVTAQRLRSAAEEYRTAAGITHLAERRDTYLRYAAEVEQLSLPAAGSAPG